MAFDIQGAREAGYSDDEIADHLSKKAGFDIEAARRAGYEAREILAELSKAWAKQDLPAGVKESDAGAGRGSVAPTDAAIPKPTPAKSPTLADLRQGPGAVLENVRQAARPGDRIGKGGVPEQKPVIGRDPLSTPNPDFTPGPADLQAAQVSDERALREVKQRAYTAKVGAPDAQAPSADTLLGESVAGVSANPLYRGMAGGVSNLAQTGIGAVRAGADALGLDGVAEFAQGASKKAGAVEQAATADLKANDKLAADIFASITASAPSMAVGMIGGPGLKTLFAQSALAEYNTGRNAGFSEAESATRAGIFGMAEALGERFGFPQQIQLLKSIGKHVPTSELGKVAAEMLAKEIPGEQLTTAMQFMADKFGPAAQNPNATLSDYLDQAGETLKVTIGQSALMGGGPVAISKAKDTYRAADKAIGGDTGITQDAESLAKSKGFLTGARPVDMRAEAFKRLDDVGAKHGIASNIVAAIKKAADGKPVEDLTGWMRRALSRLAQTGDIAPVSEETLALLDRQTEQADSAPLDRQTEQKTTPALDRGAEQDFSGLADAATPTDEAAHAAATSPRNSLPEPTEAQKAAGNYTKGHIRVAGMDLTIENPAGSVRRGTAPDGRQWETPMVAHYGYVKGTRAGDGDHSDIFVKPGTTEDWAGTAFVIDQIDPKTGKFDEHKTVLGADSEEEARALYLANYEKGWGGLGAITALPIDAYKSWVKDGIKSKPLGTLPQGTGTAAPAQQPAATSTGANDGQGQEGQRQEVLTAAPAVGVTYKAPDGRTLRIYVSTPNRVGVADEKGNKSSIARGSPGWVKMEQAIAASQPKTETAPQPAPAAAPASQPARKPKVRNHPDTVRGSNALAEISRALGGISPDIISDLSQKTTRTRTSSKTGKKTIFTTWDNPAIPGVGPLFRRGGTSDLTEIARVLEDAGYIEAGLLERDYLEARNRAQDIVKAELADGGSSLRIGDPDAIEAEMRRRAEMDVPPETPDSFDDAPASTWADDWLSPDDQEATGYTSIDPDVQAAVDALLDEAEALGIDRESLIEDAARQTADLTEKDYRERLQQLAQEAIDQARGKAVQADPAAARAGDQGGRSDAQATQRPGSDWADGSDQAVRSEGEAEGLTSAERRKLEVEYQTRATEILQEIGRRGDLKKLFRSFAGVRTVDGFTDLSIDEQASAYADYIESGAQPVTFNESYNEKVARMERDALVRRLQSDDEVRQSNGKPFKTEASAATFQADHDLGITHAPKQVDGGFVLRRRSPADQEELRRAATGRLSYAEAQKAVVAQMGIGETVDGELDATEEQFAEMERRIGVLMRGDPQTLTLTSETEAEAQAKAQREAQALADERKKRDQEQARLDKEAADREAKARADATVDDFQLGQSADQQLSGQTDIFSQPEEPASEPEGVVEIPADLGSGAPTPAPDQATKRNSAAWRDEGKTKEQLQAERIDQLALDLAATITEEASQQDFAPSELPQVMRNWAEDHRVPADALRLATLKVLDKFDLSAGRKGQIRKALADAIAEPRAMTEEGRAADGQPINPGDTFRTTSGRVTTPYPKQKGARYASDWLIDNALAEAKSRGDDFNVTSFRNERPLKSGELAPASRDSMLMYLFGQQPKVVPSILKPLTGPTRAEMIDSATKQFTALFRDMAMGGQWNVYASAQAVNGVAIHQEGMQPAGVTDVLVEGVQGMQARTMVNALNAELDRRNEAPAAKTKKSTPSGSQQSAPAQIGNPGTDSDTTPPTGGGGKPRKQVTIKAEAGDSEEVRQAKADALKALADLGDLLGGPKAMMLPEQEQKLLPVLTRLFDAAFRLGYLKFKDAAKWSLDQIRSMLGDSAADQITLDHLQGAYIGMAGKYRDRGADKPAVVAAVESLDEITVEMGRPKADGVTRAVAGGQMGVNGEWYEGGQILPTSEDTIKGEHTQPSGPRNEPALVPIEQAQDTSVETTPAATLAGSGLVVEQKQSQKGKTYWTVTGNTRDHEALLDALGFGKPFKMGGKWYRSVFDADPTDRLSAALQGNMPAPEPKADLPSLPADEATAVLRQAKVEVSQVGDAWIVTGKTFDIKDAIKSVGGKWNGKAWAFSQDPSGTLAAAIKERGGAGASGDDAGAGESDAEIARRIELRQREDARPDERGDAGNAAELVGQDTRDLILRGRQFNIPESVLSDQIEDIGLIVNAHAKQKPLFLLANEAGTGKTLVLGGAIRELRKRGETRFVYVTMNTDLIAQIQRDLADYGTQDVDFHTYSELSANGFDTDGAVLIFDEAHNVKNVGAETARANKAQELIGRAKMTLFASATLFENPVEARYLGATGIFDSVGGFNEWAKMYGAAVKVRKFYNPNTGRNQTEEIIYWTGGKAKRADGAAARAWLFKQAVMTQRAMKIDPSMVDVQFRRAPVDQKWVELYQQVSDAYDAAEDAWKDENGNPRDAKIVAEIARHRENTIKRVLEASKIPFAITEAQDLLKAGRNVVVFVETKADRHLGRWKRSEHFKDDTLYDFGQMQEMMAEWRMAEGMARMQREKAPPKPFADFIYEVARYFDAAGIDSELPSTSDEITAALGADNVAIYTGAVSNGTASKNKADFMAGRKRVLVATMAKGGTGLSLHDTKGNRPTTQLNINLPWKATGVDQVSARVARYGLASKAEVRWLFASNIPWESTKLAPRVGARMRDMGAIVKGMEVKAAEVLDGQFDFEGDIDVKGGAAIAAGATMSIYERAKRMEAMRRKADDTSHGFFETPYPLAALMANVAGVQPGQRLLEPSGGRGNLLRLLPEGVNITAVELRQDNREALSRLLPGAEIHAGDFMEWNGGGFDTVLMNPPFERKEGVGAQDVAHVQRAYEMLGDGGRLVAIMGEGAFFREFKQEAAFRAWLDDVGATVVTMPEGAFKQSGTGVRTRMVVIDKNGEPGRTDLDLHDLEVTSLQAVERQIPSRAAVALAESKLPDSEAPAEPASQEETDQAAAAEPMSDADLRKALEDLGPSPQNDFKAFIKYLQDVKAVKVRALGYVDAIAIAKDPSANRWQMILPDVSGGGKWRTQSFDTNGFSGHQIFNSKDEAIEDAVTQGYTLRDDGALDRLQDTPDFQAGLYMAELISRLNRGEITMQQLNDLAAEFKAKAAAVVQDAETMPPAPVDAVTIEDITESAAQEEAAITQIADFGQKIGGARKDTARATGSKAKITGFDEEDADRPSWARKYVAMPIRGQVSLMSLAPGAKQDPVTPDTPGAKWGLFVGKSPFMQRIGRFEFDTREDAEAFIPIAEVGRKHRVSPYKEGDKTVFGIFRKMGERKRALVRGGFGSEAEGMTAMVEDATSIIEHRFPFPERPWLDGVQRIGAPRRTGHVTIEEFDQAFGFRGVEFGKWNMSGDGQATLNHAYDALMDLADALGIPPRALSLNGELAVAFGARGQGGKGFKAAGAAHYEPDYEVINMTKEQGAGSLAHEWFHALDHYLARLDNAAPRDFTTNERGDKVRSVPKGKTDIYLSGVKARRPEARKELIAAFRGVIDALQGVEKQVPVNVSGIEKRLADAKATLDYRLNDLRGWLTDGRYNRGKKTADALQMGKWDDLAEALRRGQLGADVLIGPNGELAPDSKVSRMSMPRASSRFIVDMNLIYKAVTGRSFDKTGYDSTGARLKNEVQHIARLTEDLKRAKERSAAGMTDTVTRSSEFYQNALDIDGNRVSAYWSTPHEMAARGFEAFIMDRLAERAGRNDYLVYGAENRYYVLYGMKPYPEGDERKAISAAFGRLFEVIQTKDDDKGNVALLSRPSPTYFSALQRAAEASPMKAGDAGAWRQWLKGITSSGKAKAEEIAWSGLEEWLQLQPGKITKAQVVDFLAANGVRVEEVVLGGEKSESLDERVARFNERLAGTKYEAQDDGDGGIFFLGDDGSSYDFDSLPGTIRRRLGDDLTKYAQYTLPGGTNYREVLLTLPVKGAAKPTGEVKYDPAGDAKYPWAIIVNGKEVNRSSSEQSAPDILQEELERAKRLVEKKASYKSGHWDQPNILAHIRLNDRTDADGKRVLFVEEIQSDAAQDKRRGKTDFKAPFIDKTDAWVALALKRIIKMAVDGGYDKVAFVTGEQSAERYDLSKQIDTIGYLKNADGTVTIEAEKDGKTVHKDDHESAKLPDVIGKELAQKIMDSPRISGELSGLDLKVGGEGMRAFYDKIVPSVAKDVLRKVGGGQMTDMTFGSSRLTVQPWPGGEGFIIYDEQTKEFYRGGDSGRPWVDYPKNAKVYLSESSAKKALPQIEGGAVGNIQPGFDITPAMREAAAGGLPLFKRAQAANDAGLSASDLQPVADALTSNGVKATVLPSRDQLPPAALAEVKTVDPTGIARGALTSDGQIWLFANRLGSHAEAFEVALHEGFHRGLRLLGDKGSKVLAQIYATNAKVRKLADAYQRDYPDLDREDATNEALADLAGRGEVEKLNYWAALKRLVRDFLRRVADAAGITMEWTDADVTRFVASMSRKGLTNGAHADGGAQLQRVWHGTPHRGIEKFSTDKIGTGEGAQAYGWGLYFASKREIAEFYRTTLSSERGFSFDGKDNLTRAEVQDAVNAKYGAGYLDGVLRPSGVADSFIDDMVTGVQRAEGEYPRQYKPGSQRAKVYDDLRGAITHTDKGQLYEVEIPDDEHMLLWDKPLSEQPAAVREALAPFLAQREKDLRELWAAFSPSEVERELRHSLNGNGQQVYEQLGYSSATGAGGDRAASEWLREHGIKGIKYLDGTSRADGEGSFNYVVFSGDDTKVERALLSRPPRHTPEEQAALAKAGITPGRTLRQSVVQAWNKATMLLRNRAYLKLVAQQATLDQFVGIKDVVQRELGGLPVDQDPYITARLANGGSASVMHALLLHGQAKWAPNKQHLVKIDGTRGLLDILAPLGDDLNDWFGWMVGNRAERLKREGREKNLTDADIRALQGLANTPEKLAKFRAAAVEYAAFKRSVLDIAQGAGLIDPAGRQVWDHADYIPFYRQIDERSTFTATGKKGLAGQSSGIRVLKGGEAALNDPMENLLMNFSRLIDASLKNNALRKTIDAVDGTWLVSKVGYEMTGQLMPKSQVKKILKDAGTPPDIIDVLPDEAFDGMAKIWAIQAPTDPNVVRVMVGGKPQFYRVDEPILLRSLTSFVPFDMPGLATARLFKRVLTSAVTSTPDFLARNFIRDSLATRMISRDAVTVGSAIRGLGRSFAEKGAGEAMLFAGASFQGGHVSAGNIEGSARTMRRALRRKGIHAGAAGKAAVVIDSPARLWDFWTKARDATENANREAVYEAALKAGRGETLAAFEAKDLMDFSLRGGHPLYQVAADVLPFFNARMQGLYRLARVGGPGAVGKAALRKFTTYAVMMSVLSAVLAAINAGRDDYNRLPDWEKDTYWHLFVGGQHFKIPKPFELGAMFGSLPERITRYLMGADTGHKLGQRIGAILHDQLAVDLVPQMFRPALDVYANWDTFRDRPIETTGDEGKIPSQRFDARTSPTATAAVRSVAPLADRVGLSPKRLEYLIGGYLGTVGTYALGGVDIMVRGFSDGAPTPAWRADDIPVVKSFYAVDPARSTVYESDLYAMREEIEKVYKSINASLAQGDEAGAALLRQRFAKELEARPAIKEGAEDLATIRKDMNAIYADPRLSPKQKRELIDQLQVDRNKVAEETMKDPAVRALR